MSPYLQGENDPYDNEFPTRTRGSQTGVARHFSNSEMNWQPRILHPVKVSAGNEAEIKTFLKE